MNILQVNYFDNLGGAARIVWLLHRGYRKHGHKSWIAAGIRLSDDPFVKLIPPPLSGSILGNPILCLANFADNNKWKIGSKNFSGILRRIAQPIRYSNRNQGFEDFDFPGSRLVTSLPDDSPELVHLHNLHLNYFDLTYLPELSHLYPTVITLHDMWLLTGHCAHAMGCQRWKTGCGECPQLKVYPAMNRDQTAFNWKRKQIVYAKSRVYLTGPSKWIIQTTEDSILAPAIIKSKVIPNGIDLNIFKPSDKQKKRDLLGLPKNAVILLFVSASGIKQSSFKDYNTIEKAIEIISHKEKNKYFLFLAIGDNQSNKIIGNTEIRFISHVDSMECMARYYQASDIYLHASNADTFPTVILEAQACGTPVIATAVGGIPDTIKDGETGFLTKPKDPQDMADRIIELLENTQLRQSMGTKAARFAQESFGLEKMINSYLSFYQEILDDCKA